MFTQVWYELLSQSLIESDSFFHGQNSVTSPDGNNARQEPPRVAPGSLSLLEQNYNQGIWSSMGNQC